MVTYSASLTKLLIHLKILNLDILNVLVLSPVKGSSREEPNSG